jgi:hypothetical protein
MPPFEEYAVMVLCAADVDTIWHDLPAPNTGNPNLPGPAANRYAYVTTEYFTALAQLRCDDQFITKGENVYYGLLLRCIKDLKPLKQGDYLVAVRGTMDQQEWQDDAVSIFKTKGPADWQGQVGDGFWGLYQSMTLNDLDGGGERSPPAPAIAAMVQAERGNVFLAGHSLGAALATYLAADLQNSLAEIQPPVVFYPYFFASPKTGTGDYVDDYQARVSYYTLVNYAIDLVPAVPPELLGFRALKGGGPTHDVHVIMPPAPGALMPPTVPNNHSPIGYARMLDPANPAALALLQAQAAAGH